MNRNTGIVLGIVGLGALFLVYNYRKQIGGFVNTLSGAGLELIKQSEGFSSTPYQDVAGYWTAGFGHKLSQSEISQYVPNGTPVSVPYTTILSWLYEDTKSAQDAINSLVKVPLTSNQFNALVDLVYNIGAGAFASSTLLRELNAGNYSGAAGQFLVWDYAGGTQNAGLEARRKREQTLFLA